MSSRMQADDFFNAYQVLKENDQFPTLSAAIVCLAFSVELYIKDIYFASDMKLPRGRDGHNILKLYEGLPELIRQEVFHKVTSKSPFIAEGDIFSPRRFTSSYGSYDRFIDEIRAISGGFEKWRYSYESRALQYKVGFALALIEAIKSVSDEMHQARIKA